MGLFDNLDEMGRRKNEAEQQLNEKKAETTKNVFKSLATFVVGALGCFAFAGGEVSILAWIFGAVALIAILGLFGFLADYPKIHKQRKELEFNLEQVEKEIAEEKAREQKLKEDLKEIDQNHKAMMEAKHAYDHPECPMCKSHNTKRISTVNRATSIALVGLASSKIGKQYECLNCRHKW